MASFAPLYVMWRAAGIDPDTSYQLWLFAISICNYTAMWFLLRKSLSQGVIAASIGSWFFAFSSSLMAQVGHPQLIPQFYVVGAVASVLAFFKVHVDKKPDAIREALRGERVAVACFCACVVAQFWGSFYMGYFVALVSAVALLVGLGRRDWRPILMSRLRDRRGELVAAASATAVLLMPLAFRYLEARSISQAVGVGAGEMRLPRLASYFFMGPESVFYG
jgi:hypothetical protein